MGHRREGRVVIIVMILSVWFGLASRAGAAQTLYVQPNAAKFRENPGFEADNVLAVIPRGTPIKAFEPEGNWYPVQLVDGRTGWMHDSVLGPQPASPSRPASASASRLPVVRIGIVQDGAPSGDNVAAVFEKEIRDLLEGEYAVRFPDAMRLQADWTMAGMKAAMDRLLASRQVDIIVHDLRVFLDMVRFNKFALLVAEGITASLPQLPRSVQRSVQDLGLEVTIVNEVHAERLPLMTAVAQGRAIDDDRANQPGARTADHLVRRGIRRDHKLFKYTQHQDDGAHSAGQSQPHAHEPGTDWSFK